jgi:hypothetical protein
MVKKFHQNAVSVDGIAGCAHGKMIPYAEQPSKLSIIENITFLGQALGINDS